MILEEETFKVYGYYPSELLEGSHKRILAACDECGKIREIEKRQYHHLCKFCACKRGEKHPNWQGGDVECTCLECGTSFYVAHSEIKKGWGKYCSRKCRGIAQSKLYKGKNASNWRGGVVKCICIECKYIFKVPQNQIENGGGKFCSRKCLAKWRSKNCRRKKSTAWKGCKIKRICEECGKEFEIDPWRLKQNRGKYCSRTCKDSAQELEKIKCVCKLCGKKFSVQISEFKRGGGIFCSQKCMYCFQRGNNAPRWKGGISFTPYCFKFNDTFKRYIRAKFGNVCFLCEKTEKENGQKLSVHHVNYNKNCGCAKTEEDKKEEDATCQFVPLCASCNSKVNANRSLWEQKIKNKMKTKLTGWYI